jgi:tetratricopeptide (TPR) repeat protein
LPEKAYNHQLRQSRPRRRRSMASRKPGQPFWIPALGFYVLAAALSAIVFFIIWGILYNETSAPWIPAGILASLILIGAVILREIVLRNRRQNLLLAQEKLDYNLQNVYRRQQQAANEENKLTLEKNSVILKEIVQKSEAANVLGKLSEAHREVFELCEEYLQLNKKELETIRADSPRLAALSDSKDKVRQFHKFHLLAWSAAESRALMQEARIASTISNKLETAQKALNILESAIEFYPDDRQLIESEDAVKEFIATVKVSHWIEQAERAAFKGNYKRAINHYRDALFYLARENVRSAERNLTAEKINSEIEKIKKLSFEKENDSPVRE